MLSFSINNIQVTINFSFDMFLVFKCFILIVCLHSVSVQFKMLITFEVKMSVLGNRHFFKVCLICYKNVVG